jgi:hypothetical protein
MRAVSRFEASAVLSDRRSMPGARLAASFVWLALAGCTNPTHVLLESANSGNPPDTQLPTGDASVDSSVPVDSGIGDGRGPDGPRPPKPCGGDRDCGPHSVCMMGTCAACDAVSNTCEAQCLSGWESIAVIRNGCPACQCVPPRGCASDSECAPGDVCYAGVACAPDCKRSPACCRGNLCGVPGCAGTDKIGCALIGCPYGLTCHDTCADPFCRCDPTSHLWLCDPGCGQSSCN